MSGPDIFISYAREDRPAARHFADSFAKEGFSVWWDAVIRSGQTFDEVIEQALRSSKAVVVLWSPRSVSSRWVRAEATLADRLNKLVPAIIERCDLPIIFELTHAAELSDWTGDTSDPRWQTLVSDLKRLVGESEEAAAPAPAPEPPKPAPKPVAVEEKPPVQAEPQADRSVLKASEDELMAALERLSKARAAKLAKPSQQEAEAKQIFEASDAYRAQEGGKVHCLLRLGTEEEKRVAITPAGLRIGRSAPADLIVSDPSVSRAHCLVELAADKVRVTDLNSTNGTFIDGKRVDKSEMLPVGSVLRMGNVMFEHEVRARAEAQQPIAPATFDADAAPREARIARH